MSKKSKVIQTICSFDIEGAGQDAHVNPIIQIGAAVMQLVKEDGEYKVKIIDLLDVCPRMNTNEENDKKREAILNKHAIDIVYETQFETNKEDMKKKLFKMNLELERIGNDEKFEDRCLRQFWKDPSHPERWKSVEQMRKNSVPKLEAYSTLVGFLQRNYVKYDNVKDVSDNAQYDLARISFELNKYGFKSLEFLTEGGKYRGFGIDTGDFFKGLEQGDGLEKGELKKKLRLDSKFKTFMLLNKNEMSHSAKTTLIPHTALYDAVEIGFEYLTVMGDLYRSNDIKNRVDIH